MEEILTGDILFRHSDALGPFNIPFSKLVAYFSESKFSHASIAFVEDNVVYVLEVSEDGVSKIPLEKWEYLCIGNLYSVYRLEDDVDDNLLMKEIKEVLEKQPEYNFTFDDPEKVYCTGLVAKIFENIGFSDIFTPMTINDIVPWWILYIMKLINFFVKVLTGKGLVFDKPLHFVGNENWGMMSSSYLYKVKDVYI